MNSLNIKFEKKIPFIIYKINEHKIIKEKILNDIKKMGIHNNIEEGQSISNTDWHLNSSIKREYYENVSNIFNNVCNEINIKFNYKWDLKVSNYWFQQYKTNDFHEWHIHPLSLFTAVYYLDIDENFHKTSLKILDDEFDIDINEGDILIMPSFILHTSKPNKSLKTKTIIAFNIS